MNQISWKSFILNQHQENNLSHKIDKFILRENI